MNLHNLTVSQVAELRMRILDRYDRERHFFSKGKDPKVMRSILRAWKLLSRLPLHLCAWCPQWAREAGLDIATTTIEDTPVCAHCAKSVTEDDARRARERASRARRVEDETAAADAWLERRKDSDDPIHRQE